jgi:hypothetical protein
MGVLSPEVEKEALPPGRQYPFQYKALAVPFPIPISPIKIS